MCSLAIGKRITPHESTWGKPGNFHYCFVDFATTEEASAARVALDGQEFKGGKLRVNVSSNTLRKNRNADIKFGRDGAEGEQGQQQQQQQQRRQPATPSRAAASANWRRKE